MLYLTETIESVQTVISEGKDGASKDYFIEGVFAQAEQKNRNGRIYPKHILEGQINGQQKLITERRALGELNHPPTPNVALDRVSHMITELHWEGNNVVGKAKILKSLPMGAIAAGLMDEGVKFGVSTRGMGTVKKKGGLNEVQANYKMVCVDIVSDPSCPDAWMSGLMENASWVINPTTGLYEQQGMIEDLQEEVEENVRSRTLDEAKAKDLFEKYLSFLAKS